MVTWTQGGAYELLLTDEFGRTLHRARGEARAPSVEVPVAHLPAGRYLLRLTTAGGSATRMLSVY